MPHGTLKVAEHPNKDHETSQSLFYFDFIEKSLKMTVHFAFICVLVESRVDN